MTIGTTTVATSGSAGNGATVTFTFSFPIADYGAVDAEDQVQVLLETIATGARSLLTRGTSAGQYSVSINGDQEASPGGSITTVTTYSSAYKIWIRLAPSFLQATDLQSQSAFNAATIEAQLDQMQRQINTLQDRLRRAPVLDTPIGASFAGEITGPFTTGYALIVNSGATGFSLSAALSGATVSAAWATVIESASLSLGLSAAGLGTEDSPTFTGLTLTGVLSVSDGAVGAPSLTNTGDTNTGFYFGAADQIDATTGGVNRWSLSTTTNTLQVLIRATGGEVGFPTYSFTDDTDCGFYRIGANNIGFALNGVKYIDYATTGIIYGTAVLSSSATLGVGYSTGAGGAVTQITNRSTGVTLSKVAGAITTDTTSLAAEASATFTVTNTTVAATDTIVLSIKSGANGGNTAVTVAAVAAGSFDIKVSNNNAAAGTAETGAIVINFAVIKAVVA